MQRVIRFRAWWISKKIMLHEVQDFYDTLEDDKHGNEYEPEQSFGRVLSLTKKYIVMQFTGLKDKNGKDIYEGDIVKYPHSYPLEVFWMGVGWGFKWKDNGNDEEQIINDDDGEFQYIEVIGNVHQNPSLLK